MIENESLLLQGYIDRCSDEAARKEDFDVIRTLIVKVTSFRETVAKRKSSLGDLEQAAEKLQTELTH